MSRTAETASLEVAYRPQAVLGDDFFIFVRPRGTYTIGDADLRDGVLRCSWRRGNQYLVYDMSLRPYRQDLVRGEWTALGVPWPQVAGLLTFELTLTRQPLEGQRVAAGEVLAAPYPTIGTGDGWVYAWSPADESAVVQPKRKQLRSTVSVTRVGEAEGGTVELWLLSVALPSLMPPETIAFQRFPYRYGAARCRNLIPHGPTGRTDFLLAVSPPIKLGDTIYELGSMGGYARSSLAPLLQRQDRK